MISDASNAAVISGVWYFIKRVMTPNEKS